MIYAAFVWYKDMEKATGSPIKRQLDTESNLTNLSGFPLSICCNSDYWLKLDGHM